MIFGSPHHAFSPSNGTLVIPWTQKQFLIHGRFPKSLSRRLFYPLCVVEAVTAPQPDVALVALHFVIISSSERHFSSSFCGIPSARHFVTRKSPSELHPPPFFHVGVRLSI
jgi:hypothetical protein